MISFRELFLAIGLLVCIHQGQSTSFAGSEGLSDALLREMVARIGSDLVDPERDYLDLPSQRFSMPLSEGISPRGMPSLPSGVDYEDLALSPSLRDREYLAHSSLLGTMLGPYEGSPKALQGMKPSAPATKTTAADLKNDGVLPAYCNPPNPCPLGYKAEDGCLEEFENTAGFSRDFQAMQECMCDTEHMFQCSDTTQDSEILALARSIQNEGVLDSTLEKIMSHMNLPGQRIVAKKTHMSAPKPNPFLAGEKLPVAAKKGNIW